MTETPINLQKGDGHLAIAPLTVAAILAAENFTDDRRKLLICGTPESIAALKLNGAVLWRDVPECFAGDQRIVGSFDGVPVARDERLLQGGLGLMLGTRLVGAVTGWTND